MVSKEIFDIFLKSFKFYFHCGGIENFKKGIYQDCTFMKRDIVKGSHAIVYSLNYRNGMYYLSSYDYRTNGRFKDNYTDFEDIITLLKLDYPKEHTAYKRRLKIKSLLQGNIQDTVL